MKNMTLETFSMKSPFSNKNNFEEKKMNIVKNEISEIKTWSNTNKNFLSLESYQKLYKTEININKKKLKANEVIDIIFSFINDNKNWEILKNNKKINNYIDKFGNNIFHLLIYLHDISPKKIEILIKLFNLKKLEIIKRRNNYNISALNMIFFTKKNDLKIIFFNKIQNFIKKKIKKLYYKFNNLIDNNTLIVNCYKKNLFYFLQKSKSYSIYKNKNNDIIIDLYKTDSDYKLLLNEDIFLFLNIKNNTYVDLIQNINYNLLIFQNFKIIKSEIFLIDSKYKVYNYEKFENKIKLNFYLKKKYLRFNMKDFVYTKYSDYLKFFDLNTFYDKENHNKSKKWKLHIKFNKSNNIKFKQIFFNKFLNSSINEYINLDELYISGFTKNKYKYWFKYTASLSNKNLNLNKFKIITKIDLNEKNLKNFFKIFNRIFN